MAEQKEEKPASTEHFSIKVKGQVRRGNWIETRFPSLSLSLSAAKSQGTHAKILAPSLCLSVSLSVLCLGSRERSHHIVGMEWFRLPLGLSFSDWRALRPFVFVFVFVPLG